MSSRSRVTSSEAKCPFWMGVRDGNTIRCEGWQEKMEERLVFKSRGGCVKYSRIYCNERYEECPVYRMILQKYGEE